MTLNAIGNPTRVSEQVLEELLVVDPGHTTDLCYLGLSSRVPVDEVGCDANSQLASELLVLEACKRGKEEKRKTRADESSHTVSLYMDVKGSWHRVTARNSLALQNCSLHHHAS